MTASTPPATTPNAASTILAPPNRDAASEAPTTMIPTMPRRTKRSTMKPVILGSVDTAAAVGASTSARTNGSSGVAVVASAVLDKFDSMIFLNTPSRYERPTLASNPGFGSTSSAPLMAV